MYSVLKAYTAEIVTKDSDYINSSASNYVNKEAIIEVTIPSIPRIDPIKYKGCDIDIGL